MTTKEVENIEEEKEYLKDFIPLKDTRSILSWDGDEDAEQGDETSR